MSNCIPRKTIDVFIHTSSNSNLLLCVKRSPVYCSLVNLHYCHIHITSISCANGNVVNIPRCLSFGSQFVNYTSIAKFQTLRWRHNGRDGVSNHQPHDCLLNRLFRRRSKKTSKLHGSGLCEGNSPVPGEFPAQMASNVENVFIWWRHHY